MTRLTIEVKQMENGVGVQISGRGEEGSTPTEQAICARLAQLCQEAMQQLAQIGIPEPDDETEPVPADIWNDVDTSGL